MHSEDFVQGVDLLATESSVTEEIDTGSESSPYTLLTPSSGKRITTRTAVVQTDSSAGEIEIKYADTGKLIFKVYCSKFYGNPSMLLNVLGNVNEKVVVAWSGLSVGAKIFVALTYKEV